MRFGVAEAHVRTLTSALSATYAAQKRGGSTGGAESG